MPASVVPVIYDVNTKRVHRWFLLDFETQRNDPAFKPNNYLEGMINIPLGTYRTFGRSASGNPAFTDLQTYVAANAP